MEIIYINTALNSDFLSKKKSKVKFQICFSKNKSFKDLVKLYLVNPNYCKLLSWKSINNSDHFIYVFHRKKDNLNLIEVSITFAENKTIFRRGHIADADIYFWTFKNPDKIYLYPLSLIIWPPAYQYRDIIHKFIDKKFQIHKSYSISINKKLLNRFVYQLYKDDKRCDKSKLGGKIDFIKKYPLQFYYIKFMVTDLRLNNDYISKVSLNIKNTIRSKIKKSIPNYIHDVIIHLSDNGKHSNSMNSVCEKLK